jgi:phenylacetyl-CoA:acceptor oxidoreductase subunit 1
MARWGMLIDLRLCVGCYACTLACRVENGTPPGIWFAPVYELEEGVFPNVRRMFVPTLCFHCDDPPCLKACPTGAIQKREDGIVSVAKDVCCGTRACIVACPYGAMNYYHDERHLPGPLGELLDGRYEVGTAQKCTFCSHRIDTGNPIPACVETCPTNCRIFGDLDDPNSEISRRRRETGAFQARPEAATQPRVWYVR